VRTSGGQNRGLEPGHGHAYHSLAQEAQTFDQQSAACPKSADPVSCVEQLDQGFASDLQSYRSALAGVDYPDGISTQVDAAERAAADSADLLEYLSQAGPEASAYQARVDSSDLRAVLDRVDSTYQALVDALAPP
jgi:hypothetical protein